LGDNRKNQRERGRRPNKKGGRRVFIGKTVL